MEEWSNHACYGYALLAAKQTGLNDGQIKDLINAMRYLHDMKTLDEAKIEYRKSPY